MTGTDGDTRANLDLGPATNPTEPPDPTALGGSGDRPPPPRPPVNRRGYLIAAICVVVVAVAAVAFAAHTPPSKLQPKVDPNRLSVGRAAPAVNAVGWINSPPLPPASLSGKVVLYDFWTYSCINCLRTIPYIRSWYDRYQANGLVIIGIHSPEFDFEMNHANVTRAVKNLGVTWPVALDDDMVVWNAFQNHTWPADYIADRSGHLRYVHLGEGDYSQTEDVIRNLVGANPASPRATPPSSAASSAKYQAGITPETYLGLRQGDAKPGSVSYPDPVALPVDSAQLSGSWNGMPEYAEADSATSAIVVHYRAREVNLVLAPPDTGPVSVALELDGKPLPAAYRTSETVVDAAGTTSVTVSNADMYRLVLGPTVEDHVLRITAGARGLLAYDFTFGG